MFDHTALIRLIAAIVEVFVAQMLDDVPGLLAQVDAFGLGDDRCDLFIPIIQVVQVTVGVGLYSSTVTSYDIVYSFSKLYPPNLLAACYLLGVVRRRIF